MSNTILVRAHKLQPEGYLQLLGPGRMLNVQSEMQPEHVCFHNML